MALIAVYGRLRTRAIRTPSIGARSLVDDSGVHVTVAGMALGVIVALVVGKFVDVLGGQRDKGRRKTRPGATRRPVAPA